MPINHWPSHERPREKLLHQGARTLSDAELLAIFYNTGTQGKSAVDLAREQLKQFSSLRQLLAASEPQFCQIAGLGQAKYALLQAALELGRRYLQQTLKKGAVLANSEATKAYLSHELRGYDHEVFAVLMLDSQHHILGFEEISHGSLSHAMVEPRILIKQTLRYNASAIILAHNHPSGCAKPSSADIALTEQLQQILEWIDVRILDHIIIGDGQCTSLKEAGYFV